MSQDRLRRVAVAAAQAAQASAETRPGDEVCVIVADAEATVMTAAGFGTHTALAECLEFHAGKQRQAAREW